jgi:hypothetical protein
MLMVLQTSFNFLIIRASMEENIKANTPKSAVISTLISKSKNKNDPSDTITVLTANMNP